MKGVGAENLTDGSQLKSVFSAIYWLLKPFKRKIVALNLVYVTLTVLDLISLAFLGYYLSVLLGGQPAGFLHKLALRCFGSEIDLLSLFLILVFLVRGCFGILATYFTNRVVTLIESQVKLELLQGYQSLPYTEWAKKNSSDYINTLNVVVPKVFTVLVLPLFKMLSDSILAGAILIFFFFLNLKAFLLFTALIIAFAGLYDWAIKKRLGILSRQFKTLSVGLLSETRNTMDGAKEIRVFSIENFFSDRFSNLAQEYGRSQSLLNTFSQAPRYFLELIIVSFVGILVFLAHRSGESSVELLAMFGVFSGGALRLAPTLSLTLSLATNLRFYRETMFKLAEEFKRCQKINSEKKELDVSGSSRIGQISIRNLHFRYMPSAGWAVKGLDLDLKSGDTLAILGESGSGKTTLIDLLLGLIYPQEGAITVFDSQGKQMSCGLKGRVSYIPQQPLLIDDSLKRNVALGIPDSEIDDGRVWAALEKANLRSFAANLSNGLNTVIGDRGNTLSGGQKQRVVLARTFYFDKPVICLDEATSALDVENEAAIIREFLSNCKNKIVIAITHRPEVASCFSRQIKMEPSA